MEYFDWNVEKNAKLRLERGVTFEDVVLALMHGGLLDVLVHPNQDRYPGQRLLVVAIEDYACLVPVVESEGVVFLKTIIPSRKATQRYLGDRSNET